MSIYSIGKIHCGEQEQLRVESQLERLAKVSEISLKFGILDKGDQAVFEESTLLRGPGVVFNPFWPGEHDVGRLWRQAADAAEEELRKTSERFSTWGHVQGFIVPTPVTNALKRTRFGQFISGLFKIQHASSCGFAIFDNGIEQVIEAEPQVCHDLLFKTFLVNWDLGPNALFVWIYPKT